MKKLYHIFDKTNRNYVTAILADEKPFNAIDGVVKRELFPVWDEKLQQVVEGATLEEIAEAEKEIVPEKVKKSNFKLALIKVGISTSVITEAIYAMPASLQKDKIIVLWEDTDFFYRKDESFKEMSPSFNITQEQLDQLFILADTL